jgi:hypothetical protein
MVLYVYPAVCGTTDNDIFQLSTRQFNASSFTNGFSYGSIYYDKHTEESKSLPC